MQNSMASLVIWIITFLYSVVILSLWSILENNDWWLGILLFIMLSIPLIFICWMIGLIFWTIWNINKFKKKTALWVHINKRAKLFSTLWILSSTLWMSLTFYLLDLWNFCVNGTCEHNQKYSLYPTVFIVVIGLSLLLRTFFAKK
jgi:hypothetical protein